jgi:hypothetical protein
MPEKSRKDDDQQKISSSKSGGSLLGAGLLALGMASGCAPGGGPCEAPDINNKSPLAIELVTQKISNMFGSVADFDPVSTCIPTRIVVKPDTLTEEDYLSGNSEYAGRYVMATNTLILRERLFDFPETEFLKSGYHELVHADEDLKLMGWPEWKEQFGHLDWHHTPTYYTPEGVELNGEWVSYYAGRDPMEHHAESMSFGAVTPLSFARRSSLHNVQKEVEAHMGDVLVPAYSQLDSWQKFEDVEGRDSEGKFYVIDSEGTLFQGAVFREDVEGGVNFIVSTLEEGAEREEHELYLEGDWFDLQVGAMGDGKVLLKGISADYKEVRKLLFDINDKSFFELSNKMPEVDGHDFYWSTRAVFYEDEVYLLPYRAQSVSGGEKVSLLKLDVEGGTWQELETEINTLFPWATEGSDRAELAHSVEVSNVNSEGHLAVRYGAYVYLLDLETGSVLSRTQSLVENFDKVSDMALTNADHFYFLAESSDGEGPVFLMEGAVGDVRMRMVSVDEFLPPLVVANEDGSTSGNNSVAFSDGESAYFAVYKMGEGTSFLKASLEE